MVGLDRWLEDNPVIYELTQQYRRRLDWGSARGRIRAIERRRARADDRQTDFGEGLLGSARVTYRYFANSEAGMASWPSGKLTCSENPEYVSISLSSNETRQTRSKSWYKTTYT